MSESDLIFQINAQDRKGNTALHLAVKGGHEYLVTLLLKHPAIEKVGIRQYWKLSIFISRV